MTKPLVTMWEWFLAGIGLCVGWTIAGALMRALGSLFTWLGHRVG